MTDYQFAIKRIFDFCIALLGCIIFSLPMMVIAVAIKCSSAGAVLFSQIRIGRFGKQFICYKFRTMYTGTKNTSTITTAKDLRITKIGKILRSLKLDELPQFWNVLIGDMSFVGPRPDVPGYADLLKGENSIILRLRPGITGPASLYYRNEEELLAAVANPKEYNDTVIWPKKVAINKEYIRSWSFFKDIGYIIVTVLPLADKVFHIIPKS